MTKSNKFDSLSDCLMINQATLFLRIPLKKPPPPVKRPVPSLSDLTNDCLRITCAFLPLKPLFRFLGINREMKTLFDTEIDTFNRLKYELMHLVKRDVVSFNRSFNAFIFHYLPIQSKSPVSLSCLNTQILKEVSNIRSAGYNKNG